MGVIGKDGRRGCPDHPTLVAAFAGEFGPGGAARIRDHAERCPRCRAKLEILFELRPELEARRDLVPEKLTRDERKAWRMLASQRTGTPRPDLRASRRLKPAWIAAAVLAVVAAGYLGFGRLGRPDIVRGDPASNLKIIRPTGRLAEAPRVLVWESRPGAERYQVTIFSERLEEVFHGTAFPDGRLVLPEAIRKALKTGVAYLWTVVAIDDLNRAVGRGRGLFEIR